MTTVEQPARAQPRAPRLASRFGHGRRVSTDLLVILVAATLACSPLAYGYFNFTTWAPLGLAAVVLLVALAFRSRTRLSSHAKLATTGVAALVALSFASLLWAESRDAAWSSANQTAVYGVLFAVGLVAIRARATAWSVMVLLGLPALVTAAVLAVEFIAGAGGGAFLESRLNSPMGYVNGTAALLVMGAWPWLALAERLRSRWWRGVAAGAAALIAGTATLTQTRAILLAAAASIVLAMLVGPGRRRRCLNLVVVIAAAAAAAHWTLGVYSSTAPTHLPAPGSNVLRGAGLALLGAALTAVLLTVLAETIWTHLPPRRRELAGIRLGRALLALAATAALITAVAERGRIATQWHDFTTLNDERSADNRFLAIGGGPRYDLWRIAIDEFAGDPLGGVGAGNYADQEYQRRRQLEHVTNPHSLELQTLAELGVGGGLGLLLLVGATLGAGLTRSRRLMTGSDPALRVSALGMFTAWLAGSSVDWLYEIPGLTGMAMLAAAVLLAPAGSADPFAMRASQPRGNLRRWPALAVCLAALALLAASLGREYVGALYRDSGAALVRAHPLAALRELRSAEQLDPWSLQTQYDVAAAYARLDDYSGARAALRRAEQLEPENYVPPALLGDIARRAGYRAVALADYRHALRLDPREPALKRAIRAMEPGRP